MQGITEFHCFKDKENVPIKSVSNILNANVVYTGI